MHEMPFEQVKKAFELSETSLFYVTYPTIRVNLFKNGVRR